MAQKKQQVKFESNLGNRFRDKEEEWVGESGL